MSGQQTDTPLRVVVLGAAGFLGSSMTRFLAAQGHDVVAYWRQPRPEIEQLHGVTSVVGDIRDTWILSDAIKGADIVYHFASATYPSRFFSEPTAEYTEALSPLLVLMETAAYHGVRKIVFPSSGGTVYADTDQPRHENSATDPRSPYAIFKLAAEQLLGHATRRGQFASDIFRIGNPYGPGQRTRPGQGVLPHWIEALHHGTPIRVYGDGSASRDYIYIEDVCRLMAISCDRLDESNVFNLGTGVATSLEQLIHTIRRLLDKEFEVIHLAHRSSDIASISLSPDRLLALTPEYKFVPIEEGIRRTLKHHRLLCD
ncbi:NAD-dependent epimerase/dehydratase family protein [Novipirellula rosea]|uniref:NAD-dependent epimerase/dehydratase family protein n=1 Tax=Novipirellula rosea TaxID=1031540 RepID=A0ABP8MKD9_9BACT